jgi:RNA polymerase sigma-70 factor (ECF subfamily)
VREVPVDTVIAADEPTAADHADGVGERQALERAFERLSVDERTLLVLHHLDGRPVASIADVLGVPAGTAKSRLFAARRALERALAREDRR